MTDLEQDVGPGPPATGLAGRATARSRPRTRTGDTLMSDIKISNDGPGSPALQIDGSGGSAASGGLALQISGGEAAGEMKLEASRWSASKPGTTPSSSVRGSPDSLTGPARRT